MTIPTPTSNPLSHTPPPVLPQADAPTGLPDVATLARLATEFFSALPGSATPAAASIGSGAGESLSAGLPIAAPVLGSASNPAPPGSPLAGPGGTGTGVPGLALPQGKVPGANLLPSSPTHVLSLGNRVPALAPHAVAHDGVPDTVSTIAPAMEPRFGGAALGVPESPSCCARPRRVRLITFCATLKPSPMHARRSPLYGQDRVTAKSFGLPGDDELRALASSERVAPGLTGR